MIGRGHRGKVDAFQARVIEIARVYGWDVASTAGVGDGYPDLTAWRAVDGFRLVEVKSGKGKTLTARQTRWRAAHKMPVFIVATEDEAHALFRARSVTHG